MQNQLGLRLQAIKGVNLQAGTLHGQLLDDDQNEFDRQARCPPRLQPRLRAGTGAKIRGRLRAIVATSALDAVAVADGGAAPRKLALMRRALGIEPRLAVREIKEPVRVLHAHLRRSNQ